MTGKQKMEVGPSGNTLRLNLRRFREERRFTFAELSTLLEAAGRPIPILGLRRMERGERRVDVDDLVALAMVFQVNVSALLLPPTVEGDTEITGIGVVPARKAWLWADGKAPLWASHDDDGTDQVDFIRRARPWGSRDWTVSPTR